MKLLSRESILVVILLILGVVWVGNQEPGTPTIDAGPGGIVPTISGSRDRPSPRPKKPGPQAPVVKERAHKPKPGPGVTPAPTGPRPEMPLSPDAPLHQRLGVKLGLDRDAPEVDQLKDWIGKAEKMRKQVQKDLDNGEKDPAQVMEEFNHLAEKQREHFRNTFDFLRLDEVRGLIPFYKVSTDDYQVIRVNIDGEPTHDH